jgi:glycerophosphoryl diester phosphodiesterase
MKLSWLFLLFLFPLTSFGFELIAHRGVHQTFPREDLDNETCTASRIKLSNHRYLENTIESIEAAFNMGADIVELDVHPTREDGELVVFHDWTLTCRTDASCQNGCDCNSKNVCVTNEQTLEYLLSLDLGYGYSFDNGQTFPFRGKYSGAMPTFRDALDLLEKYPSKKILVNVKGSFQRTGLAFLKIISSYPETIRRRIHYPESYGFKNELESAEVQRDIIQADKECFKKYILVGWLGSFPEECRNKNIMIPIRESLERLDPKLKGIKLTSVLWGWPHKFIKLAQAHGTKVYASQVDSAEEYHEMVKLPLNGIMTNKIELIGPLHQL